jgi:hypothetical protein
MPVIYCRVPSLIHTLSLCSLNPSEYHATIELPHTVLTAALTALIHRVLCFLFQMSMQASSRGAQPRPPEKGSFPIDHKGLCNGLFQEYQLCLKQNFFLNDRCRYLSHRYL